MRNSGESYILYFMAVQEPIGKMIAKAQAGPPVGHDIVSTERDRVRLAVAKLYVKGLSRTQIARKCHKWLVTAEMRQRPIDQQLAKARTKLIKWENQDSFRDLVWGLSVTGLDLRAPQILEGIAKEAERGRVDAARLALEITGRHNPKGNQQPTAVVIQVNGVPRPAVTGVGEDEIIEGLAEELEG